MWNDSECEKYAEATKTDKNYTFAEKLRDALRHSDTQFTESTDDSYAVDISISGSRIDADEGIRFAHDKQFDIDWAVQKGKKIKFVCLKTQG